MPPAPQPDRLAEIHSLAARSTPNPDIATGLTVMEAVAYVAGLPLSNAPTCTDPRLAAFLTAWSTDLAEDVRHEFLLPLVPDLVGAHRGPKNHFPHLALGWILRETLPSWLGAIGFDEAVRHLARDMPPPVTPAALEEWIAELDGRAPAVGELGGFRFGSARNTAGKAAAAHVVSTWRSTGEAAAADLVEDAFGEKSPEGRTARSALDLIRLAMGRSALTSVAAAQTEKHHDPAASAIRLHDGFRRIRQVSAIRLVRRMTGPKTSDGLVASTSST